MAIKSKTTSTASKATSTVEPKSPQGRFLQSDAPSYPLTDAIRVARAIAENFAYKPTPPLRVAGALGIKPTSGGFRGITAAAAAYGITKGAWNAGEISLSDLGLRIVRPLTDGDDFAAQRDAFLTPKVVGEFLKRYDKAPFPKDGIGQNVLEDMGVPRDSAPRVFTLIRQGAESLGLLRKIKDQSYVDLGSPTVPLEEHSESPTKSSTLGESSVNQAIASPLSAPPLSDHATVRPDLRRVFITHGKDRSFLPALKDLLSFGEFEPVVSVERPSIAKPIPDKVMEDMRSCSAAVIHVDVEQKLMDPDGQAHAVLNPNVLIEIGAAMALYGRRFILLVRDGTQLPSNLQGLAEVRYHGEKLDGESTIALLKAAKELKNHPLPKMGDGGNGQLPSR